MTILESVVFLTMAKQLKTETHQGTVVWNVKKRRLKKWFCNYDNLVPEEN